MVEKDSNFYNSVKYKKKQSLIAKNNWKNGVYNSFMKREERKCARSDCKNIFIVQPSDRKKFCSQSCAAKFNNAKHSFVDYKMKNRIEGLYKSGLSMYDISQKIGWNYGKVIWLMRKFSIPRRSISEALYQKLNPGGDPFDIKENLTINEQKLLGLGLGIYWGEGNKASKHAVRVGNSDPKLIKIFREFLIKICRVKKEKIKYSLLLFNDAIKEEAIDFWSDQLEIFPVQIRSVTSLKPRGKGTYKNKSMTGVLMIEFSNIKLKKEIDRMLASLCADVAQW